MSFKTRHRRQNLLPQCTLTVVLPLSCVRVRWTSGASARTAAAPAPSLAAGAAVAPRSASSSPTERSVAATEHGLPFEGIAARLTAATGGVVVGVCAAAGAGAGLPQLRGHGGRHLPQLPRGRPGAARDPQQARVA